MIFQQVQQLVPFLCEEGYPKKTQGKPLGRNLSVDLAGFEAKARQPNTFI